jgi:ParB family chromosome partitioning protein
MTQYDLTQEQVAEKVGKSRSAVANAMRLLDLPDEVLEMLKTGDISAGHARALLGMKDKDAVVDTAKKILTHSLSVRDTESLVKKLNKIYDDNIKKANAAPVNVDSMVNYAKDLENKIMSIIGRRVKILDSGKSKYIQIEYIDNEDLDEFVKKICSIKED